MGSEGWRENDGGERNFNYFAKDVGVEKEYSLNFLIVKRHGKLVSKRMS
jgi:hypothetical protein